MKRGWIHVISNVNVLWISGFILWENSTKSVYDAWVIIGYISTIFHNPNIRILILWQSDDKVWYKYMIIQNNTQVLR